MLSIFTGRAKSGKTKEMLKLLKDDVTANRASLLFVPEQFSFTTEKLILDEYYEYSDNVTVMSFTSFCNELKRLYGGNAGKVINDSSRIMFMRKAINQLDGELKLFKTSASAINSIDTIMSAVTELKQSAVTYKELIDVSQMYSDTLLGMKLHDIALIMSTYDSLIQNIYIDPNDDLDIAFKIAKSSGYFCDKAVYFDAFSGFTGQQYNIIKQTLIDSENVALAFCTDNKRGNDYGIFANINSTVEKILKISESINIKDVKTIHLENDSSQISALNFVEKTISEVKAQCDNNDCVSFHKASNKYSELEFVATEIHRLVRTEGYRFRDFAVITRKADEYSAIAQSIFKKLEISAHFDKKVPLIETSLANFILSALRAARNHSTTEIIKYLKTNLTDFTSKEIADLDQYVYLWNIRADEWNIEWKKNPYGLTQINQDKPDKKLAYLNKLRGNAIAPLKYFNSTKEATAIDLCKNLYKLLDKCNVQKNLAEYVNKIEASGEYNESQFIISSWECVINILDDIVKCYSDDVISTKEFIDILEFSFKKCSLGGIPQGLDEVYFAPANRIERSNFKVVFIFALNYGEFPNFNIDSGLFNVYERGRLIGCKININDSYISSAIEENYCIYKALTSADERLYLSYHYGDYSGKVSEPSNIFVQLSKALSAPINNISSSTIETSSQAFSALADGNLSVTSVSEVENILSKDEFWSTKISRLSPERSVTSDYIDSRIAKNLYGENSTTTASKIEQYYKCPYAYFLKYGLNITKPLQIDFKRMQRGQIVHYVLEKFIKKHLDAFREISQNELADIINMYINEYIENNVGASNLLDEYSRYILKRILELLVDLIPWICTELTTSEFKPVEYEYNLNNDEINPISLSGENGSIKINGIIDRFDMYKKDDQNFIRIVDYKTGGKKIKLADILYGLNLQMFIYISAICESEKFKSVPAGVLYHPINHVVRKGINGEITDFQKISGVLTNDVDILKHMDPDSKYMPFKLTSDGYPDKRSLCVSNDDFREIFKYIKKKIIAMNDHLLSGYISKDPCDSDSSHRTCDYCDYQDVCGRSDDQPNKVVENIPTDEVLKIIEKENSGER